MLAEIASRIAGNVSGDGVALDRAVELATTIPNDDHRSQVLAQIAGWYGSPSKWQTAVTWSQLPLSRIMSCATTFVEGARHNHQELALSAARAMAELRSPACLDRPA